MIFFLIFISLLPVWNIPNIHSKNTSAEIVVPSLIRTEQKHTVDADFFGMKKIIIHSKKYGRKEVLVDSEDYPRVSKYRWGLNKTGAGKLYVRTTVHNKGNPYSMYLHRLIMNHPKRTVDHIDLNPFNNQKYNLRVCAHMDNCRNGAKKKNNTSGFKGVSFKRDIKKWVATIGVNGKVIVGGAFYHKIEAAKRYNELAIQYHGNFARLNIIPNE